MRRSPLAGLARDLMEKGVTGDRHVRLSEWRFTTMVSLRVDPTSRAAEKLEGVLGTTLPRTSGEVHSHGGHSVLWLGPDEWLVVSETSPDILVSALVESVAEAHAAVVDVSANRTEVPVARLNRMIPLSGSSPEPVFMSLTNT